MTVVKQHSSETLFRHDIHFPRSIKLLCTVFGGHKCYVYLLFSDVRISELAWLFFFYGGFIQANFHVLTAERA
jgi:hypothetical protein